MSRIHEALKKAEQEHTAQAIHTTIPVGPQAYANAGDGNAAPAIATDILIQPSVSAVAPDGPLQFEELEAGCARPQWHPATNLDVFSNPSLSQAAEQFRTLRSRLYQLRGSQPLRIILVTSAVPGDGKTFVTNNLAHAIGRQADRRVLIIDGDLRATNLHVSLGAPRTPGLSDYLRGDCNEMAAIQHGQESGVFLLPGGNTVTNPSELLANGRLKTLLDRVAAAFDWVIFDSPPCVPIADANMIADLCDGVLLVVRAGSTSSASAQKASQGLQGKNVIGVVLNTVEKADFAYQSYYGSAYAGRGDVRSSNKVKMIE